MFTINPTPHNILHTRIIVSKNKISYYCYCTLYYYQKKSVYVVMFTINPHLTIFTH